jgi:hypothetical protein
MNRAGRYNLIQDFGVSEDTGYVTQDPYWVIAVIRLGLPLSFSRATMSSVTKDITAGAQLRASKPLIITDDCLQITVQNSKRQHTKTLTATLKQTDVNYLVEILDGDWVCAWIVNNERDYLSLLDRLSAPEITRPCNEFYDGLKFVGRAHSIRKAGKVDRNDGKKTTQYSLQCIGFQELDTQFFYDYSVASRDVIAQDAGQWLSRIGLDLGELFSASADGVPDGNVNQIAQAFIDVILGKGPAKESRIAVNGPNGDISAQIDTKEAPYAYLVPGMVGKILGKNSASKPAQILAYADILELLQGVQTYSNKGEVNLTDIFIPDLSDEVTPQNRRITTKKMLGTFQIQPPEMMNRPLWSLLQQYVNPTINEMYSCLRVNPEGLVVPTIVFRQIPFTTDIFNSEFKNSAAGADEKQERPIDVTRFLDMPRWLAPATIVDSYDIGRSGATRTNFVHVYGASSVATHGNAPIQYQMLASPPIRDDIDIMRNGVRSYMTTVDCWVSDQTGEVPGKWMSLIADWTIGSQFTLNGTVTIYGVQSPIAEGDNFEFDGVVYHIESIHHVAGIDAIGSGGKYFMTTLQLTNGMRSDVGENDTVSDVGTNAANNYPIYPGFDKMDNTQLDPGFVLDGRRTTGGDSDKDGLADEPLAPIRRDAIEGIA